ncbi:MAG: helix-turn-helix domain-containing protein, partial [Acidimicrobiia bacterium]|nr:helix-turn-helix domain-containing protein [Acidimicrobiia bacterium]
MENTISAESRLLDQSIGDLTAALGDPTRRGIYIALREAPEPLTANQVADLFDIHANVARHHLDKLADEGFLDVSRSRPSGRGGPGAGRPAKRYRVTSKPIDVHFPAARTDHLVDLLLRLVDRLGGPDIASVAEDLGRQYGRELAEEIGTPDEAGYESAVTAVASAMTGLGFGIA